MAKKKKVRIRIDRLIILVLALIVILTGLGLFTSRVIITPMRLRSLGYNSQSIKTIRKNKATSEILKAGKCSLLVEALNDDPDNIADYTVYLIKDEQLDTPLITVGIDDMFIPHGGQEQVRREYGLDAESIAKRILGSFIGMR